MQQSHHGKVKSIIGVQIDLKDDSQPVSTELVAKSPLRKRNLAFGVSNQSINKTTIHRDDAEYNK